MNENLKYGFLKFISNVLKLQEVGVFEALNYLLVLNLI